MSNEEILNKRWTKTDETLKEYLPKIKKLGKKAMDDIKEMFDSLDITYLDLNKPISKSEKSKLDRKIDEWKENGLVTGYFLFLITSKKKYTYSDMLEILIYGIYAEQNARIKKYSKTIFTTTANDIYKQAVEEKEDKPKKDFSLTWEMIYSLLWIPTYNRSWDEYLDLLALTNEQEMYKEVINNIGQKKKLNANVLNTLSNKQTNRILSINDDKYSGALNDTARALGNKVYLEPFKGQKDLQVRFVAEVDKRSTDMCLSMNNQLFYVNDWNRFYRYSDIDKKEVLYTVFGLETGANLPPINNHFHWCRSTITYNLDIDYYETNNITNKECFVERIKRKDVEKKIIEYENEIRNAEVENMYVIQPNGNVYKFKGTEANVNFENIDVEDSIVLHNHPKDVTNYSFSNLDRMLFNNNKAARLRGTDYKYTYEMNRNVNFKETMPTFDDIIEDNYLHTENIMYSYKQDLGYKRWKNDQGTSRKNNNG